MKRRVYLLAGAAALVLLVAGLTWRHTEGAAPSPAPTPEKLVYCGTCHSMEKEVTAWLGSPHKNVACLECHLESDVAWVRHEFQGEGGTMAGKDATKAVHTLPLKAPDERCTECHQSQMDQVMKDVTPAPLAGQTASSNSTPGKAMAVIAKHELHVKDQKMACSECHTDSAHGAQPGTTGWVDQQHQMCQTCHDQKNVAIKVTDSNSCSACHTDPAAVAPADHKNAATWKQTHGQATASENCSACHLPATAGAHTPLTTTTAKASDACITCHSNGTSPHADGFLAIHGQESLKTGANCTTCHSAANPAGANAAYAKADFCVSCHAGQTMPHPAGYLAIHGQDAAQSPASCTACHSSANKANPTADYAQNDFCASCHSGQTMPHPAGYLAMHGQDALNSPVTCEACHSSKNPINPTADYAQAGYCVNCHAQPMPHPSEYVKAHGQDAMKAPATCEACHSSKNPARPNAAHASQTFCSTCHDQYQHPAGWVAGHGSSVDSSCATCHTLQGQPGQHNACSTCHTGSSQWHPDMYFITHGKDVKANGKEACMTCHAEVGPSCSKCHRDQ